MGKYEPRSAQIEAVEFTGVQADTGKPAFGEAQPQWLTAALHKDADADGAVQLLPGWSPPQMMVTTPAGRLVATTGDWITRAEDGSLGILDGMRMAQFYQQVEAD